MALRTKTGLTSLPIWRDANPFLLAIEKGVKLYPKSKYLHGNVKNSVSFSKRCPVFVFLWI